MHSFRDTVVFCAFILRAFLARLMVTPSLGGSIAFGVLMLIVSIGAIASFNRARQRVESTALNVAGRSVDSRRISSLRNRMNGTLRMQTVQNTAVINGENLTMVWKCVGYCRAGCERSIEFSIDSDNDMPFADLQCFAYDVQHDPERRHRIRPVLIGPDGISKKVAVPFLTPIHAGQPFNVVLTCELPGCMKARVEYYTASLSFEHDDSLRYTVHLVFVGNHPQWLRIYEASQGAVTSVKELRPARVNGDAVEYRDDERQFRARSVRLYVFERSGALGRDSGEREMSAARST